MIELGGKRQRTEKVKDRSQVLFPAWVYRAVMAVAESVKVGFGHDSLKGWEESVQTEVTKSHPTRERNGRREKLGTYSCGPKH